MTTQTKRKKINHLSRWLGNNGIAYIIVIISTIILLILGILLYLRLIRTRNELESCQSSISE